MERFAFHRQRFYSYVHKTSTCWLWTGNCNKKGYGRYTVERGRHIVAHRVSLMLEGVIIPPDLEVHHKCRVRNCVRPSHLEVCSHLENIRKTLPIHCVRGHELTPENIKITGKKIKQRRCLICYVDHYTARNARLRKGVV